MQCCAIVRRLKCISSTVGKAHRSKPLFRDGICTQPWHTELPSVSPPADPVLRSYSRLPICYSAMSLTRHLAHTFVRPHTGSVRGCIDRSRSGPQPYTLGACLRPGENTSLYWKIVRARSRWDCYLIKRYVLLATHFPIVNITLGRDVRAMGGNVLVPRPPSHLSGRQPHDTFGFSHTWPRRRDCIATQLDAALPWSRIHGSSLLRPAIEDNL